jgi:predicted transcriptional regulator
MSKLGSTDSTPLADPLSKTEWVVYMAVTLISSDHGASVDAVRQQLAALTGEERTHQTVATLLSRVLNRGWLTCQTQTQREIRYYYPRFPLQAGMQLLAHHFLDQHLLSAKQLVQALGGELPEETPR